MRTTGAMKSLQEIEDFYMARGYTGAALRQVLMRDTRYQKMVKERKRKLTRQFRLTQFERKKYLLSTDADFDILAGCRQLERLKPAPEDRRLVRLIKAQLEHEWRKSLLKALASLRLKYGKTARRSAFFK